MWRHVHLCLAPASALAARTRTRSRATRVFEAAAEGWPVSTYNGVPKRKAPHPNHAPHCVRGAGM